MVVIDLNRGELMAHCFIHWGKLLLSISLLLTLDAHAVAQSQENYPELPFVIITSSYNNATWVIKYLDSVFMQDYTNFRVIYIDDRSIDTTAAMVQAYTHWHGYDERITLIQNDERKLKMENIYSVIHQCDDQEIIVILDGDDWFAHERVLANLNAAYQQNDYWFVYGQIKFFEDGQLGIGKEIPAEFLEARNFRKLPWIFRHPITFYAWLFKLIPLRELLATEVPGFEGKFYPVCNDRAMIYPMLEMSQYHTGHVPQVAVIQNRFNPLSLQNSSNQHLAHAPVPSTCWKENLTRPIQHAPLKGAVIGRMDAFTAAKADCIILSDNNPSGLLDCVRNIGDNVRGIGNCTVLYQADTLEIDQAYQAVQANYPDIQLHALPLDAYALVQGLSHQHVLILKDTVHLTQAVDCTYAICQLESTFASVFDVGLSTNQLDQAGIPYQHIADGLYAWKFVCDKNRAWQHNKLNGLVMTKEVCAAGLSTALCATIHQCEAALITSAFDRYTLGLFVN